MKRKIIVWVVMLGLFGMTGCGKTGQVISESENVPVQTESDTTESPKSETSDSSSTVSDIVVEEQSDSADRGNNDIELNDKPEMDLTNDYSEDIKADVDYVVSGSVSLQEELENIEKIIQKYTPLAEAAQTQGEMNVSSKWFFVIWDAELNNLWNRFSNSADQQTKEEITRNRAYVLANELAKVNGESFVMPDKSAKYGSFVDN